MRIVEEFITVTMKAVLQWHNGNKIKYDPKKQRPFGDWNDERGNTWFVKTCNGTSGGQMIFGDLPSLSMNADRAGEFSSKKYYDELMAQGYEKDSIDGQHRTKTGEEIVPKSCISHNVANIANNQRKVWGNFKIEGASDHVILKKEAVYFKNLPPVIKDYFLESQVSVRLIKSATRMQLAEIFLTAQEGMHLSDAQKRNALPDSIPSELCREMYGYDKEGNQDGSKYGNKIKKATNSSFTDQMGFHEKVSMVLYKCKNGLEASTTKDNLFRMHQQDTKSNHKLYSQTAEKKCRHIIREWTLMCEAIRKNTGSKISSGLAYALQALSFVLRGDFLPQNYRIVLTEDKLKIMAERFALYHETRILSYGLTDAEIKAITASGGKIPDRQDYASFAKGCKNDGKRFEKMAYAILEDLIKPVFEEHECANEEDPDSPSYTYTKAYDTEIEFLLAEGVLKVDSSSKSYFTPNEKFEAWVTQGGVCTLTKKMIPYFVLKNGRLVHGDHDLCQAEGGKTSFDNLQVVYAKANLDKGTKTSEEYKSQLQLS